MLGISKLIERFLVADDPYPVYSFLDKQDGRTETR